MGDRNFETDYFLLAICLRSVSLALRTPPLPLWW